MEIKTMKKTKGKYTFKARGCNGEIIEVRVEAPDIKTALEVAVKSIKMAKRDLT